MSVLCRGMTRGEAEEECSGVMEGTLEGTEDPVDVSGLHAACASLLAFCPSALPATGSLLFFPPLRLLCLLCRNTGSFLLTEVAKGLREAPVPRPPEGGMFFYCREKLLKCTYSLKKQSLMTLEEMLLEVPLFTFLSFL